MGQAKQRRRRRSARAQARRGAFRGVPRTNVALWTLRMLVKAGVFHRMVDAGDWPEWDVLLALGVPREMGDSTAPKQMFRLLQQQLEALEQATLEPDITLDRNVDWFSERLGLPTAESQVLAFAVRYQVEDALQVCIRALGVYRMERLRRAIAAALRLREPTVRRALRSESALLRTGAVKLETPTTRYESPIEIMDGLDTALLHEHASADALFRTFFVRSAPGRLELKDFPHVAEYAELLQSYLHSALARGTKGANVLVHGAPGTGKTELARALAAAVGADLYEVRCGEPQGRAWDASARFGAYGLCQHMLAGSQNALILFDEIEDVFPRALRHSYSIQLHPKAEKAWTNRTLEQNPSPTIWIGNHIDQLDPAFIRRFDVVVELPPLPPKVRRRVLQRYAGRLPITRSCLQKLAGDTRLRAGHIQRAARATRLVAQQDPSATERAFVRILEGNVSAEGLQRRLRPQHSDTVPYDASLVNASVDLRAIALGLEERPVASLCFYGASGTGKTAAAAFLAEQLRRPLATYSASDLLSCWVGGTEANLARMFRDAKAQNALLLLDEADSFLQDRGGAHHSWEVTQVNELLVQMEAYEGTFICATNLMEVLDRAVFRRFAVKVQFDPPTAEQRWALLLLSLERLGVRAPKGKTTKQLRPALDRLEGIAHGDFAAVIRRAALMGTLRSAAGFIEALSEEQQARSGGRLRAIGFAG